MHWALKEMIEDTFLQSTTQLANFVTGKQASFHCLHQVQKPEGIFVGRGSHEQGVGRRTAASFATLLSAGSAVSNCKSCGRGQIQLNGQTAHNAPFEQPVQAPFHPEASCWLSNLMRTKSICTHLTAWDTLRGARRAIYQAA